MWGKSMATMTRRNLLKVLSVPCAAFFGVKLASAAKPVTIVVTVVTAGTPVQVSATNIACNTASFVAVNGNSGANCYVGDTSGFNKTTGVGYISKTPYSIASQYASNPLNLADYWVDADTSGDKVAVTYWQI